MRFACCCLALWLCASPVRAAPAPAADPDEALRREFVAALERVRQHAPETPDSAALESYVIHDYLVAARLRRDIAAAPGDAVDAAVDGFLRAHAGQPVARALRHDWLVNLAERRRWDWFLPRSADVVDPVLVCDRLAARLATGATAGLQQEALTRWLQPQRQPSECNPVYSWLRSEGDLTGALAESRTRAALLADNPRLARESLADVPAPGAAPLLQWLQLLEAPKAALALLSLDPARAVEPDALVAGFNRLSVADAGAAATLLPALLKRPDVNPAVRARLLRSAALGAASSRSPRAVAAFEEFTPEPADAQSQEWRVRAALWAGDFARVARWTDAMAPPLAVLPRWRYWHARAIAETQGAAAAAPLFAEVAGLRDYYGYLAADRLRRPYDLNQHASPDDAAVQAELAAEPALQRAHALFDCDLADDAGAEWSQVVGGAKPAVKVQAAHLASRWGWYAQTIATLAQAGEWDDVALRYPRPYAPLVDEAGRQSGVPADWLFAIMRQESLFRRDAVSRADARGLMQMQPPTAVAVARRAHLPPPGGDALFEPAVAVKFGALYVRELLDRHQGQLVLALASYNAGPVAVARWMPAGPVDADIWIENIPYAETRGYVQHILEHIVAFAKVRGTEPPRLDGLLQRVGPQAAAAP